MKTSWHVLLACVALAGTGCASRQSAIRYHHGSPNGESYWMTVSVTGGRVDGVETSHWFCHAENRAEPVCHQAKLKSCNPKVDDCTIVSDVMFLDELPSSDRAKVR